MTTPRAKYAPEPIPLPYNTVANSELAKLRSFYGTDVTVYFEKFNFSCNAAMAAIFGQSTCALLFFWDRFKDARSNEALISACPKLKQSVEEAQTLYQEYETCLRQTIPAAPLARLTHILRVSVTALEDIQPVLHEYQHGTDAGLVLEVEPGNALGFTPPFTAARTVQPEFAPQGTEPVFTTTGLGTKTGTSVYSRKRTRDGQAIYVPSASRPSQKLHLGFRRASTSRDTHSTSGTEYPFDEAPPQLEFMKSAASQ